MKKIKQIMKAKKPYLMYPPLGYKWADGIGVDTSNIERLREVAIDMAQWPQNMIEKWKNADQKELLELFLENGYEFV